MRASFSGKTYDRDERLGSPVSDSSIYSTEPLHSHHLVKLTTGEPSFMLFGHEVDLPSIGKRFPSIPFESVA